MARRFNLWDPRALHINEGVPEPAHAPHQNRFYYDDIATRRQNGDPAPGLYQWARETPPYRQSRLQVTINTNQADLGNQRSDVWRHLMNVLVTRVFHRHDVLHRVGFFTPRGDRTVGTFMHLRRLPRGNEEVGSVRHRIHMHVEMFVEHNGNMGLDPRRIREYMQELVDTEGSYEHSLWTSMDEAERVSPRHWHVHIQGAPADDDDYELKEVGRGRQSSMQRTNRMLRYLDEADPETEEDSDL